MNTFIKIINLSLISYFYILAELNGQTGIIRGKIFENVTGEVVIGATIFVKNTDLGTISDLDGNFELTLVEGKYNLIVKYTGFSDYLINEVVVVAGAIKNYEIQMKEETSTLNEIVVTASQIRNTESAISTIKQKSSMLLDGISAQSISRNGDGNAGEALRRVTGVSVEEGKHAVVRGLGDRYTKIILNSSEVPGLDADKNSFQIDIFPTNLVDNILVYKCFSPELPGDFTGGAVDIITKDFPDRKTMNLTIGLGFNPNMHFKSNFLRYNGSKTDFLGFDNGQRALPFYKRIALPDPSLNNPALSNVSRAFNQELAAKPKTNNINKNFSFAFGNQSKLAGGILGYTFGINYAHGYNHYDEVKFNEYYRNTEGNGYFLNRETSGTVSEVSVLWSAISGLSYKKGNNKIKLEVLRIQNGNSKAGKLTQANVEINPSVIQRDNLEYIQKAITNFALSGKHHLFSGKIVLDWKVNPNFISVDEPDIRTTGFDITENGNPILRPSVGAEVTRIFRNLNENNNSAKFDLTYTFKTKGKRDSKIRMGAYTNLKHRNFEVNSFLIRVKNQSQMQINGQADNILNAKNIWTPESGTGAYVVGNYEPANTFSAKQKTFAIYAMNEMPFTNNLKLNYGLRIEKALQLYTGQNNQGNIIYVNKKVLEKIDFLPSMNLIYSLKPKLNVRASFNRTVARPTFRENSIAQIQDRITDRTFIGNIGLKSTNINNYDLRIEKYFEGAGLLSATIFLKQFYNPIQLAVYDAANPTNFTPKNFNDTDVIGFEMEANKSLAFISEKLSKFNISSNYTYVHSNFGLVGLSPSLLNIILSYDDTQTGWNAALAYNVHGKRLSIVGIDRIEDIYEMPFKSLNIKISKQFGPNQNYGFSFHCENILNSKKQRLYETIDESEAIFDIYQAGRLFTTSFCYNIK